MDIKELEKQVAIQQIDQVLTQLYVNFINGISDEMEASIANEDRGEFIDYNRGSLDGLAKAAEIFRKHHKKVSGSIMEW